MIWLYANNLFLFVYITKTDISSFMWRSLLPSLVSSNRSMQINCVCMLDHGLEITRLEEQNPKQNSIKHQWVLNLFTKHSVWICVLNLLCTKRWGSQQPNIMTTTVPNSLSTEDFIYLLRPAYGDKCCAVIVKRKKRWLDKNPYPSQPNRLLSEHFY